MAVVHQTNNPETTGLTSALGQNRTIIRPHPSEDGVFLLERAGIRSTIRQGLAKMGGALVKYTYETPLDIEDPVPLMLVPGYGGIKPAYKELRKSVVKTGKPAVTFKPPRSQEKFAALHPKHFLHPERLLTQAVLAVTRDMKQQDGQFNEYEKVDTAGHSMGGPAVINAGLVHPEWFRNITAMASAGLDGHTLNDMRERAPAVFRKEIMPAIKDIKVRKDYRVVRDIAHYVARNPWRTLSEGLAVGSGDIRDKVRQVGALGVKTAALQFRSDWFFPVEGVREHSAEQFDLFRVFPDPEATHMWPQLEPEAVANELVDIVNALQASEDAA